MHPRECARAFEQFLSENNKNNQNIDVEVMCGLVGRATLKLEGILSLSTTAIGEEGRRQGKQLTWHGVVWHNPKCPLRHIDIGQMTIWQNGSTLLYRCHLV